MGVIEHEIQHYTYTQIRVNVLLVVRKDIDLIEQHLRIHVTVYYTLSETEYSNPLTSLQLYRDSFSS